VREGIIESVLKDFPGALYYPKFHLMSWRPVGIFDAALADKVIEFIEREEYIQDAPFDRYTDLSAISEVQINLQHLLEVGRRRWKVLQPVNSAIFADKKHTLIIAQIYASLMEDAVMITVRAFQDRESAAQWLGVPVTILGPPPSATL
jgi:hypothetical protein